MPAIKILEKIFGHSYAWSKGVLYKDANGVKVRARWVSFQDAHIAAFCSYHLASTAVKPDKLVFRVQMFHPFNVLMFSKLSERLLSDTLST